MVHFVFRGRWVGNLRKSSKLGGKLERNLRFPSKTDSWGRFEKTLDFLQIFKALKNFLSDFSLPPCPTI